MLRGWNSKECGVQTFKSYGGPRATTCKGPPKDIDIAGFQVKEVASIQVSRASAQHGGFDELPQPRAPDALADPVIDAAAAQWEPYDSLSDWSKSLKGDHGIIAALDLSLPLPLNVGSPTKHRDILDIFADANLDLPSLSLDSRLAPFEFTLPDDKRNLDPCSTENTGNAVFVEPSEGNTSFESNSDSLRDPMHDETSTSAMDVPDIEEADRSNMLMTPQELERMPEQGIEFEESVGPREPQQAVTVLIDDNYDTSDAEAGSTDADAVIVDFEGPAGGVVGVVIPNATTTTATASVTAVASKPVPTVAAASAPVINSVDIVTYADNNQSEIRIITDKGEQVYLISSVGGASFPNSLSTSPQKLIIKPMEHNSGDEKGLCSVAGVPAPMDNAQRMGTSDDKPFHCPYEGCKFSFTKASKLKAHVSVHSGDKPFKCPHPGCKWAFSLHFRLKRHMECHEKKKEYQCEEEGCGRRFSTVYNLHAHRKMHVPKSEAMGCTEPGCTRLFTSQRNLDTHLKHDHENATKHFKCPVDGCRKMFYSNLSMGSHLRRHAAETPDMTCTVEGCGRKFKRYAHYKEHVMTHDGTKPYACEFEGCTWSFTSMSKLRRHAKRHYDDRQYVCEVPGCNKSFLRKEHLRGHMVIHSGQKPFCCPVPGCEAQFSAKSTLHMHVKRHKFQESQSVIHCPVEGCTKVYLSTQSLRCHVEKHMRNPHDAQSVQQLMDAAAARPLLISECSEVVLSRSRLMKTSAAASAGSPADDASAQSSSIDLPGEYGKQDGREALRAAAALEQLGRSTTEAVMLDVGDTAVSAFVEVVQATDASSLLPTGSSSLLMSAESAVSLQQQQPATVICSARTDPLLNLTLSRKAKDRQLLLKQRIQSGSVSPPGNLSTHPVETRLTAVPVPRLMTPAEVDLLPTESSSPASSGSSLGRHFSASASIPVLQHGGGCNSSTAAAAVVKPELETGMCTDDTRVVLGSFICLD